jgi:hypothetical protein
LCLLFPSTDRANTAGGYEQFYLNVVMLIKHVPNPKNISFEDTIRSNKTRYNFCSSIYALGFLQLYHRGAVVIIWSFFLNLSNLLRSAPWILKSILKSSSLSS